MSSESPRCLNCPSNDFDQGENNIKPIKLLWLIFSMQINEMAWILDQYIKNDTWKNENEIFPDPFLSSIYLHSKLYDWNS